jgi:hypothetical protein
MPLISAKSEIKPEKVSFKVASDLLQEIKEYCEAFEIKAIDNFFCEAAHYVLKNDRDWIKIHKEK